MKLSITTIITLPSLALLTLPPLALAQSPTNCNPATKSLNPSDFILTEQPDNPNLTTLSKIFTASGRLTQVSTLFTDTNRRLTADPSGHLT